MRIACCISALIVLAACGESRAPQEGARPISSESGPAPTASAPSALPDAARTSRIEFPTAHGAVALDVATDETIAPGAAPRRVDVIGELPQRAIVIVDRYPSVPGGLSMCQAGEESFVRVVALNARPRVTFAAKIGSCLQNIELADPGLEWRADSATLRIDWLSNAAGMPETHELAIATDGSVLNR